MNFNEDKKDENFDVDDLKTYMALSVEEKLAYLQDINNFFMETMSAERKKVWEELKKIGW